jgi:hypothetical protein
VPFRFVHLERQALDQAMVLVPGYPEVADVSRQFGGDWPEPTRIV